MTTPDRLTTALADRYRIEVGVDGRPPLLGQGGMATVYLAQDRKHDRKVAVKVLRPELAAVLGAERFVQEIKTTVALSHPHILPLLDSGEAGQRGSSLPVLRDALYRGRDDSGKTESGDPARDRRSRKDRDRGGRTRTVERRAARTAGCHTLSPSFDATLAGRTLI